MNPLPASAIALIAHALGWTLLHFLWQGALVALILACVLALLSGRSPQPRYVAACAALVLMAILPLVTFTCIITAERSARDTNLLSIPLSIAAIGHGLANPPESLLYRIAAALDRSISAVLAVWLAGVVLLFIRLGIGLIIAHRMMSAATQPPPHDLLHVFQRLTRRIEVSRPVRLLHSALVQVPTVIGWLHPVVLIPLGCLSGLSPTQVEAILAHELAHIRRHDYLVSVLQSIVEALFFYHPAVWWVSRYIRREREHCCDDLAVQFTGDALTYARALSLLEERRASLPTIALAANGGILTMRIKRLLDSKQSPAASQFASLALLGIVIAATAVCIGTAAHAQNNQSQNNPSSPATPIVTGLKTDTEVLRGPEHSYQPVQKTLAKSDLSRVANRAPALKQDAQTLCALQVIGNHSIPSESVLAQLLSKQGGQFDPQLVEQDTNMLFNTGYFDEVRIQHVNTDQCVQLAVYVQEKPPIRQVSSTHTSQSQPQAPSNPIHVAAGVMSGQVLTQVNPIYPPDAKAAHVQGAVVLDGIISKDGIVKALQVISGPVELRVSAIDAVRQWRFEPYLLNGQPTEVETTITVNYQLDDDADSQSQNDESATGVVPKKIGGGVSRPVLIYSVQPEFSEQAKKDKVGGTVIIRLWVDEQGRPEHVRVLRGVGNGLDEKAVEAVKQYKFKPAMEDGKPVLVELNTEVNFKIF
jgi:TonB family protein